MGKLVAVAGRVLSKSNQAPATLTYTLTEVDVMALKSFGAGKNLLIKEIKISCNCSGNYAAGQTFTGTGTASIQADTKRVKCQGESVLVEGDWVNITCNGTITDTSSSATSPGSASVTVTITNAGQSSVFAGKI